MMPTAQQRMVASGVRAALGPRDELELREVTPHDQLLQVVIWPTGLDRGGIYSAIGATVGAYVGTLEGQYGLFEKLVIDLIDEEQPELTTRLVLPSSWAKARSAREIEADELVDRLIEETYHVIDEDGEVHDYDDIVEWLDETDEQPE